MIKERRLVRLVVQRTNSGISLETLMPKDRVMGAGLILQAKWEVKILQEAMLAGFAQNVFQIPLVDSFQDLVGDLPPRHRVTESFNPKILSTSFSESLCLCGCLVLVSADIM